MKNWRIFWGAVFVLFWGGPASGVVSYFYMPESDMSFQRATPRDWEVFDKTFDFKRKRDIFLKFAGEKTRGSSYGLYLVHRVKEKKLVGAVIFDWMSSQKLKTAGFEPFLKEAGGFDDQGRPIKDKILIHARHFFASRISKDKKRSILKGGFNVLSLLRGLKHTDDNLWGEEPGFVSFSLLTSDQLSLKTLKDLGFAIHEKAPAFRKEEVNFAIREIPSL